MAVAAKAAIFLSVRNKATRLPGKVLLDLAGKPVTERLLERLSLSSEADLVAVATSPHADDAVLGSIAERVGVGVFYGSEDDKLQRYLDAARHFGLTSGSDLAVIVDGDDPFCDPIYIDRLIRAGRAGNADFLSVEGLPVGATANAIRLSALERVCRIKTEEDTEVWGGYFTQTGLFQPAFLQADLAHRTPELRMTLDYPEDYAFFQAVYERLHRPGTVFSFDDIMSLLREQPDIAAINREAAARYEANLTRITKIGVHQEALVS